MNKLFVVLLLTYSSQAFAYLDPGSASLIVQGLIAGIASVATAISLYWTKIKSFFYRNSDKDDEKNYVIKNEKKNNDPS